MMAKRRMGELLVESGELKVEDLLRALNQQQRTPTKLGEILLSLSLVQPAQVYRALAHQHGLPFIELEHRTIPEEVLSLLPAQVIVKRRVLPLGFHKNDTRGPLFVATSQPEDLTGLDELRWFTRHILRFAVASPSDLSKAIRRHGFERNHEALDLPEQEETFEIVRSYY